MFVVRYIALAALAIWLGGAALMVAETVVGHVSGQFPLIAAGCGGAIFICLFIMKFVGPPPPAFALRAALAFVITVMALYLGYLQRTSMLLTTIQIALGLVLLTWYARE